MKSTARATLTGILVVAAAIGGIAAPARCDVPPLAEIQADVAAATRPGKLPVGAAARAATVHRLVELHGRIVADPRFATSPEMRALRGRVAARLTHLRGRLERDLAGSAPRAAAGGGVAEARALIDLIQATVRPASWDVNGGTGTIVFFENGHGLVVSAPEEVHEELGDLLRKLR